MYITSEDGVTSVLKTVPVFEVIAENNVNDYCSSTIAVSDGQSASAIRLGGSNYFCSAFSTAPTSSGESGSTPDSKREMTFPFPSTRNLVKFHLTSPPALSVRYL